MSASFTAGELAARVGGALEGDAAAVVRGMAGLREAAPGDISFLGNPRYAPAVASSEASVILVRPDWAGATGATLIRVKDPSAAFAAVAALFAPPEVRRAPGVHPSAVVAPDAVLGEGVHVGPRCVIEEGVSIGARSVVCAGCVLGPGTVVGEDCLLHPLVSTREGTRIGDRVIIHNGAVIGSDGFGFTREGERWVKIRQAGTVEIGNDVEIGANTTIDRARFGKTVIEDGAKLDNLIQIAHNVRVGAHTAIAAMAGVSGSTRFGRGVQVGGQAGFVGHITIGDGAVIGAQAGVIANVPAGHFVAGFPAEDYKEWQKAQANVRRLDGLRKQVRALAARIEELGGGSAKA